MTTDNDLDWLAFCYASGELDPTQIEQFELRLADDHEAREALARAVELCQTITAAESQNVAYVTPASRVHSDWNQRLSWMAVGGLASLLLGLLWTGIIGPTWQTAQRNYRASSQQNLAFAWSETGTDIANVREAGYWPALISYGDDDSYTETTFDDSTDDAPSWMTAAVLSVSGSDSSDGDSGVENPNLPNG